MNHSPFGCVIFGGYHFSHHSLRHTHSPGRFRSVQWELNNLPPAPCSNHSGSDAKEKSEVHPRVLLLRRNLAFVNFPARQISEKIFGVCSFAAKLIARGAEEDLGLLSEDRGSLILINPASVGQWQRTLAESLEPTQQARGTVPGYPQVMLT